MIDGKRAGRSANASAECISMKTNHIIVIFSHHSIFAELYFNPLNFEHYALNP